MITLDQVQHVAQVMLHSKFLAVRLMGCPLEDRLPAASLALELFYGSANSQRLATQENANRLLDLVAKEFEPFWHALTARECEPLSASPEQLQMVHGKAFRDLLSTNWAAKILHPLLGDATKDSVWSAPTYLHLRETILESSEKQSEWAATEYLRLREDVLGWSLLQPIPGLSGSDFCRFIRTSVDQLGGLQLD